jgi:hypothetical protein
MAFSMRAPTPHQCRDKTSEHASVRRLSGWAEIVSSRIASCVIASASGQSKGRYLPKWISDSRSSEAFSRAAQFARKFCTSDRPDASAACDWISRPGNHLIRATTDIRSMQLTVHPVNQQPKGRRQQPEVPNQGAGI